MRPRPSVIVFDVNETLSDMAPMAGRFADVGAPELLAKVWFAALLRDGFALTATGGTQAFTRLAAGALRTVLAGARLNRPADEAVEHVLSGFADLSVHPDVPGGTRILRQHCLRLVTLSNGSAEVAGRLLAKAGIRGEFEQLLSVEAAAPGSRRPPPTPTPPAPARHPPISCCWWRCTPGTSTAHTRRACARGGSPGRQRLTRTTSAPPTCKHPISAPWPR